MNDILYNFYLIINHSILPIWAIILMLTGFGSIIHIILIMIYDIIIDIYYYVTNSEFVNKTCIECKYIIWLNIINIQLYIYNIKI
jgi:hypothetical protein